MEDLARFLAPKRPERATSILRCFYNNDGGCTLAEMMRETGMREKALRYYITRFRRWRLLRTERRYCQTALYHLELRSFHVRLDTLLCDPLRNFQAPKLGPEGFEPPKLKGAEAASA